MSAEKDEGWRDCNRAQSFVGACLTVRLELDPSPGFSISKRADSSRRALSATRKRATRVWLPSEARKERAPGADARLHWLRLGAFPATPFGLVTLAMHTQHVQ